MPHLRSAVGKLASAVLAPPLSNTSFATRGFPGRLSPNAPHLESIPRSVVCGFEWGLEEDDLPSLSHRLQLVDPGLRGFAYEGAAMGLSLLDALKPHKGGRRVTALLEGPGSGYVLLSLIGVGFAMNHVPRALWPRMLPEFQHPYLPAADWLAVDGYGFDLAYFRTDTFVDAQQRPRPYAWRGDVDNFLRVVDQGIGRALWFICGGRASQVVAAVGRFASSRHADLWSGVGLAATFAGPAATEDLFALTLASGEHLGYLKQGAAFACRARVDGRHVPSFSEQAAVTITGWSLTSLADLVLECLSATRDAGGDWEELRSGVRGRLS